MNRLTTILQLGNNCKDESASQHSSIPPTSPQNPELFRHKPQIVSIPGVSPKERNRYRVIFGNEVLGGQLTIEQAITLANQSTHH